ncbi:MAG: 4-hydroxy-tetrahydrodipicolinate synthase [Prevotellamassilia sp.]
MNRFNPFKGLGTALVTPFRKDGSVDEEGLTRLVEDQIAQGVDFLCVLGTTAETPCLSAVEKRLVMNLVKRVNAGRLPLLLGAGGNHTAEVIDYLQTADLEGFAGVLIVTPYYNKPSQEGLYQHFCAVAAATDLPVVLYNVPGRTGVNLAAETTLRIARDCKNVVAVKEASGKLAQIEQILAGAPEGFEVLSGDDAITLEILTLGGAGVISVVSNAYPARFAEMAHAALAARLPEALAAHRSFLSTYPLLSVDGNPAGIKALLSLQGKIENILRLPLVPVRPETYEALQRTL